MYYDNNVTQYYKPELDFIKFDSIREATELMLSRAPKFYMDVDAASNPRYSKDRDGNILKLKEHTKAVARYVLLFLTHPTIRYQFTDIQRDYMVAAALVHDLAKRGLDGEPSKYILFEHPILIAKLVPDYSNMSPQIQEHLGRIINIASAHNGPWTTNNYSETKLPEMTDNMQYYLHLADWLASRGVTWIDTSDDKIGDYKYDK